MIFKEIDFKNHLGQESSIIAAQQSNQLLSAWLDRQIIVYGFTSAQGHLMCGTENAKGDTFVARLVGIKELKPQVCFHKPKELFDLSDNSPAGYACQWCGVKMKVQWEVET